METHGSTSTEHRSGRRGAVPGEGLADHADTAFTTAGALLLASVVVPAGIGAVAGRPWLAGLALVGLAVVAVAAGLVGLYPRAAGRSPRLSLAGAASGAVAGTAGLVLLALSVATVGADAVAGYAFSLGMPAFAAIAITMAGGYALGFLAFGAAGVRSGVLPRRAAWLLAAGGALLAVPVVGALLQLGLGTGLPPWVLFPVLGLVAVDTLAVGRSLRSAG